MDVVYGRVPARVRAGTASGIDSGPAQIYNGGDTLISIYLHRPGSKQEPIICEADAVSTRPSPP